MGGLFKGFENIYICGEQFNLVGMFQSVEDNSEEGLAILICNVDQFCFMYQVGFYCCILSYIRINYFVSFVFIF